MRPTWIVLGLVVGLGAVTYAKIRSKADAASLSRKSDAAQQAQADPPKGPSRPESAPGPASADPVEAKAAEIVAKIEERSAAKDAEAVRALSAQLEQGFPDALATRRHVASRADAAIEAAKTASGVERIRLLDRARRDLARGLDLPEMFDAAGRPNAERAAAFARLSELNASVYGYKPGLPGVTEAYVVKKGDSPLRIVDRDARPYGPNVVLFWNYGKELRADRLRAGDSIVLPTEPLSVAVDLTRRRLAVRVGGVPWKEFDVGIGKAETPTPPGLYEVKDKYNNPVWHSPNGVIPYGDPRNELGDAWVEIASAEHPKGYGIHGTNRPDTVGTPCSNGCVRLVNREAVEMLLWVRTGRNRGAATRIEIR
jgi:lipoprotein-anchoring transpeptidase ErfK/SrfK